MLPMISTFLILLSKNILSTATRQQWCKDGGVKKSFNWVALLLFIKLKLMFLFEDIKRATYKTWHIHILSGRHIIKKLYSNSNVKKCKAFYIGEMGQTLSKRVNGHRSICMVVSSDLPVPIHIQSHQLPFQECWSVRVIHKLPHATPDHVHCQYQTAHKLILKSHQFPGINIR